MIYPHERNLQKKINDNYKGKKEKIENFYNTVYLPMRDKVLCSRFTCDNEIAFIYATDLFNEYYDKLLQFSQENEIQSQSKFESTFLEEISCYLFKDLPEILSGDFDIYNKRIYAGLKIDNNKNIATINKDVDFCIGKKVTLNVDGQERRLTIIIPVVAVEVKTYLDATMFGEVKSSSKAIRSACPNSKTYVLMGYKDIADEHIIAARQDSALTEIFVLRKDKQSPMDAKTLFEYYKEIENAVNNVSNSEDIVVPGRLLKKSS